MRINRLYDTWFQGFRKLRPKQHLSQDKILVWLLVWSYKSRSVPLSRIASRAPGKSKLTSVMRRLVRLLDNPAILLVITGKNTVHAGQRDLVVRNDRRDLNIFQIRLRWMERRFVNACRYPFTYVPTYYRFVEGGLTLANLPSRAARGGRRCR